MNTYIVTSPRREVPGIAIKVACLSACMTQKLISTWSHFHPRWGFNRSLVLLKYSLDPDLDHKPKNCFVISYGNICMHNSKNIHRLEIIFTHGFVLFKIDWDLC